MLQRKQQVLQRVVGRGGDVDRYGDEAVAEGLLAGDAPGTGRRLRRERREVQGLPQEFVANNPVRQGFLSVGTENLLKWQFGTGCCSGIPPVARNMEWIAFCPPRVSPRSTNGWDRQIAEYR